jgi:hypothetical protein
MRASSGCTFAMLITLAACSGKERPFADGPIEGLGGSSGGVATTTEPGSVGRSPQSGYEPAATDGEPVGGAPVDIFGPTDDAVQNSGSLACEADASACTSPDAGPVPAACIPAGPRDCTSDDDNDCDGLPDNTLDSVCGCVSGTSEPCDEHPGLDGQGQCRGGLRTCLVDELTLTTAWGECEGAVGPGGEDSCEPGDDTDCDGTPNEGCSCVDGQTQPCGSNTNSGPCQIGVSTCVDGRFGSCVGAVAPASADSCSSRNDDSNCNGIPFDGCSCVNGETQPCGMTDTGVCQLGTRTCGNGAFGQCVGQVNPSSRDCRSPQDNDCDGRPDNTIDNVCQCIPGQGNGPCNGDPNNSRCNGQGQCVPCQVDADCSLMSGSRNLCGNGQCIVSVPIAVWDIARSSPESLPATSTVAGVAGLAITRSPPIERGPALEIFANRDWPRDDESIDLSEYFEFGVAVDAGRNVTYDELELAISCQSCAGDASANWQIRSSIDNFASIVANGSASSMLPNPAVLRPSIRSIGTRAGTVRFRFYAFNVRSTSGQVSPIVGLKGITALVNPSWGPGLNLSLVGGVSNL